MGETRLRDLVELPEVRTVIQLADLEDETLAQRIVRDFILTSDCDFALTALLRSMTSREGQGFFLQGNFGSGKSHLLAVVRLLFRSDDAWEVVVAQGRHYEKLRSELSPAKGPTLVAAVSLVEHSGSEKLEDLCLSALEGALRSPLGVGPQFAAEPNDVEEIRAAIEARHRPALEAFLEKRTVSRARLFDPKAPDLLDDLVRLLELPFRVRRERGMFFDSLEKTLGRPGGSPRRGLLVIDELSEFLRSKPDTRAFNEDVRFLQFLGEASRRMPFTILAALQEQIESTGEIDQATFGKIKDRYPSRLVLSGTHLREIASARLIKKKPGAEARIIELYRRFRSAFSELNVSESEFVALYPVHPATVDLLDDLLPLFSRHRGAVDFLHYQLAGDETRGIPGMLDEPPDVLLGPDAILDHFRVRIRETLESSAFITVVLAFYEKELSRLFADPEDRKTALRLVKILILLAISPINRRRTVKDLAEMLLHRLTDLDPRANYDYVREKLETMRMGAAYLSVKNGAEPLDDQYFIDLAADVQLIIKRRVEALLKDPGFTLGRSFETVVPSFSSPELPLASLAKSPRSERRVSWQRTRREGIVLFCRGEADPLLSDASLDAIQEQLETTELDFAIVVLAPESASAFSPPDGLLARLRDRGATAWMVWAPEPLDADVESVFRRAAARLTLVSHFREERSEVSVRILEALEPLVHEDLELAEAQIQRAYRSGTFSAAGDRPGLRPADLPSLDFNRVLERIAELPLSRRFPDHARIAPSLELPAAESTRELLREFFRSGEADPRQMSHPLRQTVESQLRPLGLLRTTSEGYRLEADPSRSQLIRFVLDRVSATRVPLDALFHELRKGRFGLNRPQFELLVLGLAHSGQVTAFAAGRRLPPEAIGRLDRVEALGPGEMLAPELKDVLATIPIFHSRTARGPLGTAQQRQLWQVASEWKSRVVQQASDLENEIGRARSYHSAHHLDIEDLRSRIRKMTQIADAIKTSYPPREGLERLAQACREEPELKEVFDSFDNLVRFFAEEWERYLFTQRYLNDPALEFPSGYEELKTARQHVIDLASRPEIPTEPELWRELRENMQAFGADYTLAYEREHRAQKSPDRLAPLLALRDTKAYDILRRFSHLNVLSVDDDRVRLDRALDENAARVCNRLAPELLRSRSTCECGFRLGEQVSFARPEDVAASVERGVRQYVARLGEPRFRELIVSSFDGLGEVGKRSIVEKIRRLLRLDPESPDLVEELDRLLDGKVVTALLDALTGHTVLVERDWEELAGRIVERSFPRSKLLAIFERWMDRGSSLGADDYIKVVSSAWASSGHRRLRDVLGERFPELQSWWDGLGEKRALREMVLAYGGRASAETEPRLGALLEEAFRSFAEAEPEEASRALDSVEAQLGMEEKAEILDRDASRSVPELVESTFSERCFRFVVAEQGANLLRLVLAGEEVVELPPPPAFDRLGLSHLRDALENAMAIRETARAVDGLTPPPDPRSWEMLFRKHLAEAPLAISRFEESLRALKLETVDSAPFTTRARKALDAVSAAFETFYLGRDHDTPNQLANVFAGFAAKYRGRLTPKHERFVFLDAMRWDTWTHLKATLLPKLNARYRVVDEVPIWSIYPTTTQVQLERAGIKLPAAEPAKAAEPGPVYGELLPGFHGLRGPHGEWIERSNLVDEKLHESSADLCDLTREIELQARRTLAVLLEEAPRGTLLLLFSDHGFRENPRWTPSARHHRPRYSHGGASPWEVITPLVVLYRS